MSAIAGIYCLDGRPIEPEVPQRMIDRLVHRGPDSRGIWSAGAVGLGQRLLHTTPHTCPAQLSRVDAQQGLVVVADARLDNRRDLLDSLRLNSRPQHEISDSELILRAYEQWGEACPENLIGDFAFAIWDSRRQVLFCARDHFGVKPFYYYHCNSLFAFASEIKALLTIREVTPRLNEDRVADYLLSDFEDRTATFYQDLFRLHPGHTLLVSGKGVQPRRYWRLDPDREIHHASDQDYAEEFREIFTEAVRCRLRSSAPIGSMLSGGLDSSSIVCVARALLADVDAPPLQTFSVIFDDLPQCDERVFIAAVQAQGRLTSHFVRGDQLSPLGDLETTWKYQDEPFHAPNLFLHWGLYRTAQEQGIRVLLDGLDGDLTVSHGIGYLVELARTGRWIRLAIELSGLAQHFDRSPWRIFFHNVLTPLFPQVVHAGRRLIRKQNTSTLHSSTLP